MFKKTIVTMIIVFGVSYVIAQHAAPTGTPFDVEKSKISWHATKVTGEHNGTLNLVDGMVKYHGTHIHGGKFVFDMNSIVNVDIESEEWNAKLVDHLKSDDFFSVTKFPTATIEIMSARPIKGAKKGEVNYIFKGDLTIKDIVHEIEFNAVVGFTKEYAQAAGEIVIDRTLYDVRYGSGKFFENLGDKMIHDEFIVSFDVITKTK
ncbi:MAG: YceI family protein [Candidatus Marinimicrobia bacterium]|nr:YceI family protein [Candidatus Neomarinimicrobiota bacterium]